MFSQYYLHCLHMVLVSLPHGEHQLLQNLLSEIKDPNQIVQMCYIIKALLFANIVPSFQRFQANSDLSDQTWMPMQIWAFAVCICLNITKTCLYNFDPLIPHLIVKLGFTGVYIIFLISAQKHRLWVLVRTALARWF